MVNRLGWGVRGVLELDFGSEMGLELELELKLELGLDFDFDLEFEFGLEPEMMVEDEMVSSPPLWLIPRPIVAVEVGFEWATVMVSGLARTVDMDEATSSG